MAGSGVKIAPLQLEFAMHVHGNQRGIEAASLYAAAAAEKAAAAQRAAEVRKKLLDRASKITGEFKQTAPVSRETEEDSSEEQDQERRPMLRKKRLGGAELSDEALSTWA
jgi:hypothetical protein